MQICLEIPSRLGAEIAAMEQVAIFLEKLQFESFRIEEIKTVVSESILNAIEHGNKFDESKNVSMNIETLLGGKLLLIVEDFGSGINACLGGLKNDEISNKSILNKIEIGRRGLGLYFISKFSDNIVSQISNKKHIFKVELSR